MSLKYSDEKLAAMAKSFLNNYRKDTNHQQNCEQLIMILAHHFGMNRSDVLNKIEGYAAMEVD